MLGETKGYFLRRFGAKSDDSVTRRLTKFD
jgi:hypothetical protein